MKRSVSIFLIVILLLSTALTGCSGNRGDGSVICLQFVEALAKQDYASAYACLADEVKNVETDVTPSGQEKISYKEFEEKYTSIFSAMELTSISYKINSVANGTITAAVDYEMTYYTDLAGNLTFNFTISSEYREAWVVLWSPALIFPNMEWGDTMLSGINYPQRGEIFDADGVLLAENVNAVTVYCIPSKIELKDGGTAVTDIKTLFKANDEDLTAAQLQEKELYVPFEQAVAAITELGITEADVRNSFARTYQDFAKLVVLYPDEMTDELEARLLAIPGVGVDSNNYGTLRQYPYGTSLCHILGYAGVIQKEYIQEYDSETGEKNKEYLNDPFYDGDSWLGYAGLEKEYELKLRGEKGSFAYIQGKNGSTKQILYNIPAVDGGDLHLSIKISMQQRAEQVIENVVYDDSISGTVVVLNPTTGAVEAMVSFPGYNPNDFSRGDLDEEAWAAMQEDLQAPLLNRAIQGLYPPGSTYKPLTAIAALESGTMTLDSEFPADEEGLKGYDTIWNPSKGKSMAYTGVTKVTRTYSTNRHSPMNMYNSMVESDNIFFAYCAMKIGWQAYTHYLEVMGLGEAIPFDLPTRTSQLKNTDSQETYDLLAMTGYGQGELLLTPLQMACYISAFRNGGAIYEPYIIESVWQESGKEYNQVYQHETTLWKDICAQSTADAIEEMLVGVCALAKNLGGTGYGTGRFLGIRRTYTIAGKTGTAELDKNTETKEANNELAWFIAYRSSYTDGSELKPEDERLVLVMLELDMTKLPEEWNMMKFLIAQALLKDDSLTEEPVTETCMNGQG